MTDTTRIAPSPYALIERFRHWCARPNEPNGAADRDIRRMAVDIGLAVPTFRVLAAKRPDYCPNAGIFGDIMSMSVHVGRTADDADSTLPHS